MATPQGRIFRKKDLQLLLEQVGTEASDKWKKIGLALKFHTNELNVIRSKAQGDPDECFTELLTRWLGWASPEHDLPSSHALAEALRCKTVGEERLANDLEQRFSETGTLETETVKPSMPVAASSLQPGNSDPQDTVIVEPPPVAESAAPDDQDDDDLFFDAEDTETMKSSPTPKELPVSDTQGTVMGESPVPESAAIDNPDDAGLHSDAEDTETMKISSTQKEPSVHDAEDTGTMTIYLTHRKGLCWEEWERQQERLAKEELKRFAEDALQSFGKYGRYLYFFVQDGWSPNPCAPLVERYLDLAESVKEALKERGITAREVRDTLWEHGWDEGRAYMERVMKVADDLQEGAKIQEVLDTVTSHSSFPDSKPLEHLIKTFNLKEMKEVEEKLEQYEKELQHFMQSVMENSANPTSPPWKRKSRGGPDPEARKEQCTTA